YVLALKPVSQEIVVGPRSSLDRTSLTASGVNWIIDPPRTALRASAQIRYRHVPASAIVRPLDDDRAEVTFDSPQIAGTPGQAVVFYGGDVVAGGGWID